MKATAPTPRPALRLTLAAALAVVLVLPAVGVVCAPDTSGDFCPMMAASPMPTACAGTGDAGPGSHAQPAQPPMDCCVADEAPAPVEPTAVAATSDSLAVPTTVAPLVASTSPAAISTGEADRAPRALSTPLYTLHSSLLS